MQDMERAASANARLIQDRQALIKICGDMRRANCKWSSILLNWLRLAAMFFLTTRKQPNLTNLNLTSCNLTLHNQTEPDFA